MNRRVLLALISWSFPCLGHASDPAPPTLDAKHRGLFENYCVSCHGPEKQKGKFRLDDLPLSITNLETAERWQKVLNQLNSGEMPPEGEKQLPNAAKTDFLDDLSNAMVAARRTLADQNGLITMRRLNRREYQNTLRDLLGVETPVAELPPDTGTGGFDTFGANLFLSSNQIEQYQSLGLRALDDAFLRSASPVGLQKQAGEAKDAEFVLNRNRQVDRIHAPGLTKVHYECEQGNAKVSDFVKWTIERRNQAEAWVKAFKEAAAKPENAALADKLRKEAKSEQALYEHWGKLGAPSPKDFGFGLDGASGSDQALQARADYGQKYHEYYLGLSDLDRGAYLGCLIQHPAELALGFLQLPVPREWTSGHFIFRVRIGAAPNARPEQRFLEIGTHPRIGRVTSTFEVRGTIQDPQILEMPFSLTKDMTDNGDRMLFIREKGSWDNNEQGFRRRGEAAKRNGIGPEAVLWVDWMEIERVPDPAAASPGMKALGIPFEDSAKVSLEDVRAALERFCAAAFRGMEPPASFLEKLTSLYDTQRQSGVRHGAALKETLSTVLASPMFLYLAEPVHDEKRHTLTGVELANRLSYFLWSAPPDETLLALGKSGELLQPEVLAKQTARLLESGRAEAFVHDFVHQWLGLDRLDFFQVNHLLYPRFDDATKLNARREIFETFAHLLKHNAPLSDLLKSDYVVVNHLLADFYGLEGVKGDAFQKVSLPAGSPRGGLLGMAAVHFMGGNGERTNPVERGAWVLRKLLNDPPPPAPANVPQLARLAGKVLSTRERMQAHQEDAQCASCHRKIDPLGFGLENFDAAGQWRTEDSYQLKDAKGKPVPDTLKTWPIEARATLHKGPSFADFFELRDLIASKSDAFAKGFSTALLEYALGRSVGFRDEPLLSSMCTKAKEERLGLRAFIHTLVASPEFRTK
ncbi:MAG: hypothetical protein RLZZ244_1725 [Verrucomicrobiota bacterium]